MGAYAELIDNNGAFAEFVRTYASMEEEEDGIKHKLCLALKLVFLFYRNESKCRSTCFSRKVSRTNLVAMYIM